MTQNDPVAARLIDAGFDAWAGYFERGLRTMRENGDLAPATDVAALARAVLAIVQGGFILMQSARSVEKLSQALDTALLTLRQQAADR
jgi:TetR/AcrR family transcriptional regulator, transcriptional repressor for nem operon